ncbi:MAG: prepilin-type N-terminal cleavage/methylation domain-containing protein [bacterium]|nr:prepilin-type N-terminal cleavage/methylation domain-containing protein [bacterium]
MQGQRNGFSLAEVLVSLAVLSLAAAGLGSMLVQNSQINKSQQMSADIQSNARSCLSVLVRKIRSAGWDPTNVGFQPVVLDPNDVVEDDSGGVSQLELLADHDADGLTNTSGEQIFIRHNGDEVQWRSDNKDSTPFVPLAVNITNDSDGDGNAEPMFVPDGVPNPSRITITVTASSPVPDPISGRTIRYTVSSDVVLRKTLN